MLKRRIVVAAAVVALAIGVAATQAASLNRINDLTFSGLIDKSSGPGIFISRVHAHGGDRALAASVG